MAAEGTVVWRSTSRRAAWRALHPALLLGALFLVCALGSGRDAIITALLCGGLIVAMFGTRALYWYLSVGRRELHISEDHLRMVLPRDSYSMAWSDVGKVELIDGDRWPEWAGHWAFFSRVTVSNRDPWKRELEHEFFAMSKYDMDALDQVLSAACRKRSIQYKRFVDVT